ncbi:MAG: response regulator transcription factor [Treponema sp.]|jgi:DNA-binding NarL/FixJ family response regulator|nr:response regulator transcription factor [Treponema sp.]
MTKIAIISKSKQDWQTMFRILVSQEDFDIFFAGVDGYEALKSATVLHPDIIIMDFQMGCIDGPSLAPMLKRRSPSTALIVMGSLEEEDRITKSVRDEISGYLLKELDMDKLIAAVRIVSSGGCYFSAPIAHKLFRCYSTLDRISPPATAANDLVLPGFSPVEQEIVEGIARGHSDTEIADHLHISSGTVRNCLSTVKRKTGLRNRTQMVLYALMFGWIRPGKIEKQILKQL